MEIEKLKATWDKFSSLQERRSELNETELHEILNKRTKNTIERIERNIRIGSVLLFVIILILVINDFLISPLLVHDIDHRLNVPVWLNVLDIVVNILIIILFSLFVIRYTQVKRSCLGACNLRNTLVKIIRIMKIYKRLFGLALIVFLFSAGSGFIAGLHEGITMNEIPADTVPVVILSGIIVLALITGGLFLFLRWGFRRLYGQYFNNLKLTLSELDELE